jgi:hypothetical protein
MSPAVRGPRGVQGLQSITHRRDVLPAPPLWPLWSLDVSCAAISRPLKDSKRRGEKTGRPPYPLPHLLSSRRADGPRLRLARTETDTDTGHSPHFPPLPRPLPPTRNVRPQPLCRRARRQGVCVPPREARREGERHRARGGRRRRCRARARGHRHPRCVFSVRQS